MKIIRQVNEFLRDKCERNNFQFVSNDNILEKFYGELVCT